MRIEELPGPNNSDVASDNPGTGSEADVERTEPGQSSLGEQAAAVSAMLGNHKGKLAVGAAAMLGLAVFYKWRENKLAKEDPAEYARIQRLKAVVGSDNPTGKTDKPGKSGKNATDPDQGNKK
ncbi:hypothetical protein [Noviherbaspirillum sp. Root189]|uniref:hypothetical protein n=1 Tax=Noviherbaspirillum sp. Root189 TaxID=1736487 RepID=UPI00070FDC39|nr:hypothetical protein [Noviherbaspirillum sp. Root189]KRB69954.1 hypothetical protein ASE07_27340 [Noviherbaspirillum sp. Root189]